MNKSKLIFFVNLATVFLVVTSCSSVFSDSNRTQDAKVPLPATVTSIHISTPTRIDIATKTSEHRTQGSVISTSPDGNWNIIGITEWDVEAITSKDGKIIWELHNEPEKFGWFEWSYAFYRWSRQSDYVYLTLHPSIDGFAPFYLGTGLYQFNLINGDIGEVLSGKAPNLSNFSLSPDEKLLAYVSYSEDSLKIIVKKIESGLEKQIFVDSYDNAGYFLWSPRQEKIVFSASTGDDWSNWRVSLMLIDLRDETRILLYDDEQQSLRPEGWINDDEILVSSGEIQYYFNIKTKNLEVVSTATPKP